VAELGVSALPTLSPVTMLRDSATQKQTNKKPKQDKRGASPARSSTLKPGSDEIPQEPSQSHGGAVPIAALTTPSRNKPFQAGELVLAMFRKKYYREFKKMFKLRTTGVLTSNRGTVQHEEIIGKLPGQMFRPSPGFQLLITRPTLEEYVLLMDRGPAISYPKDIAAALLLMDITPGDVVLEAGSGSSGMSLFLSRAVGPQGHVISYEVRKDHHNTAMKNYRCWREAWEIGHIEEWPDNVKFINKDIIMAAEDLECLTYDAVALDMINPQAALPAVYRNLRHGGVCAVYVTNITQVTELLEGIRTCKLPFFCEKVLEVTHRNWLVTPARWNDGSKIQRVDPQQKQNEELLAQEQTIDEESEEDLFNSGELLSDYTKPYSSVPYVARPYSWQAGHTGRKIVL
uniref:tRNA (adenine(58)-N(1))-methyltransferase n=1 Tax=Sphenodon punctatus TaxID=8508 RepID=A0A8D0GNY7_SPHPU